MSFDNFESPKSRSEAILQNILGASYEVGQPKSRIEALLLGLQEQLNDLIGHGLEIFRLKGEVDYADELPESDNEVGDVWYVKDKSAGYVWLITEDNPNGYWEELGETFDLANAPNIFFPVDYYNTTFAQIKEAKDQGKIPILKLNDEYYYCGECYNNYTTFSKPLEYGGTNLHCYIINNSNVWGQYEISIAEETSTKKFPYYVDYARPNYSDANQYYITHKRLVYTNYNNRNYIAFNKGSSSIDFFSFDSSSNKILLLTLNSQDGWTSDEIVIPSPFSVTYTAQSLTDAQKTQARTNIGARPDPTRVVVEHTDNGYSILSAPTTVGELFDAFLFKGYARCEILDSNLELEWASEMYRADLTTQTIRFSKIANDVNGHPIIDVITFYINASGQTFDSTVTWGQITVDFGRSVATEEHVSNNYVSIAGLDNYLFDLPASMIGLMLIDDTTGTVAIRQDITPLNIRDVYTSSIKVLFGLVTYENGEWVANGMVFEPSSLNPTTGQLDLYCVKSGVLYQITLNYNGTQYTGTITQSSFAPFIKYTTLTLAVNDWLAVANGYTCQKTVTGMTTTSIVWLTFSDTEIDISTDQRTNALNFAVADLPTAAITVNVTFVEGSALT